MEHPTEKDLVFAEQTLEMANKIEGVIFYDAATSMLPAINSRQKYSSFDGYKAGISGALLNAYNSERRLNAIVLTAYHQINNVPGNENLPDGAIISSLYENLPFNVEVEKFLK